MFFLFLFQFVDCVWQVTRQFPFSFEFNEVFLIHILDHLYSCLFGTFLYNSERERHEANVRSRTQSLWSYVLRERRLFENSSFRPDHSQALEPKPDLTHFLLWKSYFLRWNPQVITVVCLAFLLVFNYITTFSTHPVTRAR